MEKFIRLNIEAILFRNGVVQSDNDKIFDLIDINTENVLFDYDKWCETLNINDSKLSSKQLVNKFLNKKHKNMKYELIDLDIFETMPTIESEEMPSSFESDFIANFENGNEDESIRIEGNVEFDIESEDASYTHDFGTEERIVYWIEKFNFSQVKIFINDVKVSVPQEKYQTLFNEIENNITNLYECN
jgi:hypothetical protein